MVLMLNLNLKEFYLLLEKTLLLNNSLIFLKKNLKVLILTFMYITLIKV
jgi:hypothetical protein